MKTGFYLSLIIGRGLRKLKYRTLPLQFATMFKLRIAAAAPLRHFSASSSSRAGNDYNYYDLVKNFTWNVPENFNFAQDIIDNHATGQLKEQLALLHVGEDGMTETKFSYAVLSRKSKEVAAALNSLGKITRAVTVLPKVPEWWLLNIAALRTGTVLLPGTTLLTASDIAARIDKSESDCVIGDADVATKVETRRHANHLRHKILVASADNDEQLEADLVNKHGWVPLQELMAQMSPVAVESLQPRKSHHSDLMQIFFTSGTTGAPKMVPQTMAYAHWTHVIGKYWLDLTPADLHWNIADTGWAKSAWSSVFGPWNQGATVFVHGMKRFSSGAVLKVLSERPITTLCAPPTLYRGLVKEETGAYKFKALRHCVSAGEPLNEEVISTWRGKTGISIKEGYGQTETGLVAATFKGMETRCGSMGKPAPGMHVRVVDDNGEVVPSGEEGNLGVQCRPNKPHGLFDGYIPAIGIFLLQKLPFQSNCTLQLRV